MRAWVFLVSVLLSSATAHAVTVEGSIREKGTRAPVPAAYIYAVELDQDALADEEGRFFLQLGDEPPPYITLEIESPGYATTAERVAVLGKNQKLDVYLTPAKTGTTRVRERRSPADRARGMHRISEREVNELPGTYGDPAKAIENFPGMGRVRRSQGSLFVRGARPGETAVYVDDFEVPDLYHFTGSTSVINIPFVESVELVPGAFSARFGRATGGLVQLKTRKLPTDDVHGFAKVDVIDGGAYIGVPLSERAAVGISARRSYLDVLRQSQIAIDGGTGDEVQLVPTYWDYQLKLDWDVTDGHELVVFAFGSGDRELYTRDGQGTEPPFTETNDSDFARLAAQYRHLLGGGFTHKLTPVIGFESRRQDLQNGLEYRERTTFDVQVRDEISWRTDDARVIAGLDTTLRADLFSFGGAIAPQAVRDFPTADIEGAVKSRRTDAQTVRGTGALFAEGAWEPLEGVVLTPGVRLDLYWYDEEPQLSIEPRAAGSYAVTDGPWGVTLKAGGGVFGRPPDPDDIVAARLAGRKLPLSQALHMQSGFEQGLGDFGTFSTTLFSVVRDRLPVRAESFPVPEDPLRSPVARTGSGLSVGAEVLLRLARTGDWFGWMSYSVARHQQLDGPGPGAVTYPYPIEFDTTHLLVLVGQYQLPWGFRLGGRYRVATGMPERVITGGIYDADSGTFLPTYGPKGGARFDVFQALDLRVDWSLLLPWFEAVFYADLVNFHSVFASVPGLGFLNATEDREYSFDYRDSNPIRGLPLIPTAGVKVTF